MNKFLKYGVVGLVAFLVGSTTVIVADDIEGMFISSPDGRHLIDRCPAKVPELRHAGPSNCPAISAQTHQV